MNLKIKRVLISASDRPYKHLYPLLNILKNEFGSEIFSTGGTAKELSKWGIETRDVSELTNEPAAFGGRVKTISFKIAAALLFNRDSKEDCIEAQQRNVTAIDLLICNLYNLPHLPELNKTSAAASAMTLRDNLSSKPSFISEIIEKIDIGGVTLIRAGAKNFASGVAVVTDMTDCDLLLKEIIASQGALSLETRKYLMLKAFKYTADYETNYYHILNSTFSETLSNSENKTENISVLEHAQELRYGENPHQKAYISFSNKCPWKKLFYPEKQISKAPNFSYNNISDSLAAIQLVGTLEKNMAGPLKLVSAAIIKHGTPCGAAVATSVYDAIRYAYECDPVSAYGGIIAVSSPLDLMALKYLRKKFVEILISPSDSHHRSPEFIQEISAHKKLIHLTSDGPLSDLLSSWEGKIFSSASGEYLKIEESSEFKLGDIQPNLDLLDKDLIKFALISVRECKSNAIAIAIANTANSSAYSSKDKYFQLISIGQGQTNRVQAVEIACNRFKAATAISNEGDNPSSISTNSTDYKEAVLVSDGFFPFADSIEIAAKVGIKTIIQPGGSIRDQEVINKCKELGINLIMTGVRYFKH